jgi:polar amino acid transport system substrate-binding protein
MQKRVLIVIVMALLLSLVLASCGGVGQPQTGDASVAAPAESVLSKIKEEGVLRVGLAQTTPGAFKDVDTGEWTGIHVDVANELAKFLDVKLEIVETSWDLFLPALNSGEFDIYMPGTFYTGQRALQAAYTTPAYYKGVSAIVRADDDRFNSIEDFNQPSIKLAVRLGAVEAELAPKFFPEAEIVEFKTDEAPTIAEAVKVGNADVWLADEVLQSQYLEENDWAKRVGEPFGKYPIGYVVRYGDADWLMYLNNFVEFMRSSGQMRVFVTRYGQDAGTLTFTP